MRQVVISRSMSAGPDRGVELVKDDAVGMVQRLKRGDGLDIWRCRGAESRLTSIVCSGER